jgi:hypothetical protein
MTDRRKKSKVPDDIQERIMGRKMVLDYHLLLPLKTYLITETW